MSGPGQLAPYGTKSVGPGLYYPDPGLPIGSVPDAAKHPLDVADMVTTAPKGLGPNGYEQLSPGRWAPRSRPGRRSALANPTAACRSVACFELLMLTLADASASKRNQDGKSEQRGWRSGVDVGAGHRPVCVGTEVEAERLRSLAQLHVFRHHWRTATRTSLHMACTVLGVPLSAILFIDEDSQWCKTVQRGHRAGLRRTSQRLGLPGNHCSGLPRRPRRSRGDPREPRRDRVRPTARRGCRRRSAFLRQSPVVRPRRAIRWNLLCL